MERLKTVLAAIEPCGSLIDIGCDHGKLCLEALRLGRTKSVTACDISLPSLNKAKALLTANGYSDDSDEVRFVCADGQAALAARSYDTAVISGMGGHEIIHILSGIMPKTLVLQPQNAADTLRRYLNGSGYRIDFDRVCKDGGKFYDVIRAVPGQQTLSVAEYEWGAFAMTVVNEVLIEKLLYRKKLLSGFAQTEENKSKLLLITEVLLWQTSQ